MLKLALRNLYRNKLRNLLTLLGVAIGMSVLISSVSVSGNFRTQLDDIVTDTGADIIIQSLRATTPMLSRISRENMEIINEMEEIKEISSTIMGFLKTPWAPYFLILGISSTEALASQLSIVDGRWFKPGENSLVLGYLGATELGYSTGNKILLTEDTIFTVSGIFSFGYPMADGAAVMDITVARKLLNRDDSVNMILANVSPDYDPYEVIRNINSTFPHLYAASGKDFVTEVRFFDSVDLFTWMLSMVSLITCCLVVINTLVMSVSERIKEIGILLAIGWSKFMIYRTILYESVIICLLGSLMGSIVAFITLRFLQGSRSLGLGLIPVAISPEIVTQAIILSILLGFLCSLYPVYLTLKMSPAKALRYE